jgi:hypothetical protein
MSWMYRLIQRATDETSLTLDSSVKHLYWGSTGTPCPINTADDKGVALYFSSSAASGTTYGQYVRLDATGAGVEAIAGRFKTTISSNTTGQAYGIHATVEPGTSTGKITGQCAAVLGNLVMADRAFGSGGTYYGVLAQVYPAGNVTTAGNISCLGLSCPTGTEIDKVVYAINISGGDATGSMIYTATNTHQTFVGSIRILVNGVVRYLHFCDAQAGTS